MKRMLLRFACIVIAAGCLSACGGSPATSQLAATQPAAKDGLSSTGSTPLPVDQSTLENAGGALSLDTAADNGANSFDASTLSADGTRITFTIYVPNIVHGNVAPLLLQSHGFGGERTRNIDSTDYQSQSNTPLQTAKLALSNGIQGGQGATRGWYVISFDQRGFGQSGGQANIMDPELEGRDVSAVIDWAVQNLPRLAYRRDAAGVKKPVIGAVGLSYGGGFQTIGAGVDPRLTALVPTATWNDLRYSLNATVPKSLYLAILTGIGTLGVQQQPPSLTINRLAPFIYQEFVQAYGTGSVDADFVQHLYLHSPASYCDGSSPDMRQPGIPALFIQASSDILFNLNDGFRNFACFRQHNPASKLLVVRYGHPDPIISGIGAPKFTEQSVDCSGPAGSNPLDVAQQAYSFLSQNLVDRRLNAQYSSEFLTLPDLRAVLDDGRNADGPQGQTAEHQCYELASLGGAAASAIPSGGAVYPQDDNGNPAPAVLQDVTVGIPSALLNLALYNDLSQVPAATLAAYGTPGAGRVIPLVAPSGQDRRLFGTPTVHLTVNPSLALQTLTAGLNPPILFVGLVRQTPDGKQQLVHDQVWPVKGFGEQTVALPGISLYLHGDEALGLVVFGFHPQYFNDASRLPQQVEVGPLSVALPFLS